MDLPRGRIESGDAHPDRLVALPAAWVGEVLECLPDGIDSFADRLVAPVLADVNAALEAVDEAAPEDVAYALSLAFARRGFGLASFERAGDALVLVWRSPPASGHGFREFAARLAARVVGDLLDLRVRGAVLGGDASALRILLASPETCQDVRALAAEGTPADAILEMLSPGDAA